jgi:hypothetical protein
MESIIIIALQGDAWSDQRAQQSFACCFCSINQPCLACQLTSASSSIWVFILFSEPILVLTEIPGLWNPVTSRQCYPTQCKPHFLPLSSFTSLTSLVTIELPTGFLQRIHKHWDEIHLPCLSIDSEICTSEPLAFQNTQFTLDLAFCIVSITHFGGRGYWVHMAALMTSNPEKHLCLWRLGRWAYTPLPAPCELWLRSLTVFSL